VGQSEFILNTLA